MNPPDRNLWGGGKGGEGGGRGGDERDSQLNELSSQKLPVKFWRCPPLLPSPSLLQQPRSLTPLLPFKDNNLLNMPFNVGVFISIGQADVFCSPVYSYEK